MSMSLPLLFSRLFRYCASYVQGRADKKYESCRNDYFFFSLERPT
jgi:hypothetical protein